MTWHQEWPMEVVIERRNDAGEWVFAGAMRDDATARAWLARHGLGDDYRVVLRTRVRATES